jgi:hypothetical protein
LELSEVKVIFKKIGGKIGAYFVAALFFAVQNRIFCSLCPSDVGTHAAIFFAVVPFPSSAIPRQLDQDEVRADECGKSDELRMYKISEMHVSQNERTGHDTDLTFHAEALVDDSLETSSAGI